MDSTIANTNPGGCGVSCHSRNRRPRVPEWSVGATADRSATRAARNAFARSSDSRGIFAKASRQYPASSACSRRSLRHRAIPSAVPSMTPSANTARSSIGARATRARRERHLEHALLARLDRTGVRTRPHHLPGEVGTADDTPRAGSAGRPDCPGQQSTLAPVFDRDGGYCDRCWHQRDCRAADVGILHRGDNGHESESRHRKRQDFASHHPSAQKLKSSNGGASV